MNNIVKIKHSPSNVSLALEKLSAANAAHREVWYAELDKRTAEFVSVEKTLRRVMSGNALEFSYGGLLWGDFRGKGNRLLSKASGRPIVESKTGERYEMWVQLEDFIAALTERLRKG